LDSRRSPSATRPGSLRVRADDLPLLIALGIGLAVVQWSYFFAIHRLDIGILGHISATRAGITAMLEPVVAIIVAWAWLGESLQPVQLSGAALTLPGIGLAQTAR
jgi:drug/metabolite transporter (DMT)-like permease